MPSDPSRAGSASWRICWKLTGAPFFPETARVYVSRLLKGKTGDEALRDAGRTWAPERGYAEGQDPYFRFCFGGGKEALDDRFRELAGAILGPLLEHAGEVR